MQPRAGAMPGPSKKPARPRGLERFRSPSDVQTLAVSSLAHLDELTCFLQYLLSRIDLQCEEIRRKLGLYESGVEPSRRAAALRERAE